MFPFRRRSPCQPRPSSRSRAPSTTDLRDRGALPSRPFGDGRLPGGSESFWEGALPRILVAAIVSLSGKEFL